MSERYSIEVDDSFVEIYGYLTIEEAFDFLSFFERKGYKAVIPGNENSTLRMMKSDQEEVIHDQLVLNLKEKNIELEEYLKNEKESHEKTKEKLNSVELCIGKMEQNPEVKKYFPHIPIPNCCSTLEKQLQYEELLGLKKHFPHIPIPNYADFCINPKHKAVTNGN